MAKAQVESMAKLKSKHRLKTPSYRVTGGKEKSRLIIPMLANKKSLEGGVAETTFVARPGKPKNTCGLTVGP